MKYLLVILFICTSAIANSQIEKRFKVDLDFGFYAKDENLNYDLQVKTFTKYQLFSLFDNEINIISGIGFENTNTEIKTLVPLFLEINSSKLNLTGGGEFAGRYWCSMFSGGFRVSPKTMIHSGIRIGRFNEWTMGLRYNLFSI